MEKTFKLLTRETPHFDNVKCHLLISYTKGENSIPQNRNFKITTKSTKASFQTKSHPVFR
jgi:hypothetical protein